MKRILLFGAVCFFTISQFLSYAQVTRGLKGEYDTKNYPEVSFVWNSANPEKLERSQFALTDENNKAIDFKFQVLSPRTVNQNKNILFLWEDMASHSKQTAFTRQLLRRFFRESQLQPSDKFNVAVFNRKKSSEPTVTRLLAGKFTSNTQELQDLVDNYHASDERFNEFPQQSDLYLSISEGITTLKKESSDNTCIIVVITAGLNIKASGASTEMESVRQTALKANIPIYVVKYPLTGDAPEVNSLAESTYGLHTSSTDVDRALEELQRFYRDFDTRCYGQDYKITFTTDAKRDGKQHRINLSINKEAQNIPPFTAPDVTFGDWVRENIVLFVLIIVVFVAIVIVSALFIHKRIEERNSKIAENEALLQKEINNSSQKLEELRRQQEEEKKRIAAEAAEKERAEKEKRLTNLMRTKNMFPRLQCKMPDTSFTYTINNIHTTLGRNENNDVVLNNKTVSGFHAEINFNGTTFELINKSTSYTKGIIVNGQFFQQRVLKNGDMIGLGEVVITFYI